MDRLKVVRFLYFIWQVSKLRFQNINLKNWRMSNIIDNIWEAKFPWDFHSSERIIMPFYMTTISSVYMTLRGFQLDA